MASKSWFHAKARGNGAADIAIFSDIGGFGVTAQDFHDQLLALGDVDELNISISSDGGDVFVGFAIFNMLRRHSANKIVTVEGLAASMASVIVMAGDEVVMPSNAMIMIHNPWGGIVGESDHIISFGEALDKMRKGILKAYRDRTGIPPSQLQAMMDKETWLDAKEAVSMGFADRIEKPIAMAASVNVDRFRNVPALFGHNSKGNAMSKNTNEKPEGEKPEGEKPETVVKSESVIRSELLARQKEIRSLCKLAGMPELADGFVDEDKSTTEVIAALDAEREKRAKAKPGTKRPEEVSARHNPNAPESQSKVDPVAIYDHWNSAGKNRAA